MLACIVVAICTGCWQEIAYQPSDGVDDADGSSEVRQATDDSPPSDSESTVGGVPLNGLQPNEIVESPKPLADITPIPETNSPVDSTEPEGFAEPSVASDKVPNVDLDVESDDASGVNGEPLTWNDVAPATDRDPLQNATIQEEPADVGAEEDLSFLDATTDEEPPDEQPEEDLSFPDARRADPLGADPFSDNFVESDTETTSSTPPAAEPDLSFLSAPTAEERRAARRAASRWSLAAAVFAKSADADAWQRLLTDAKKAADRIALEMPPLPKPSDDRADAVLAALSDDPDSLGEQFAAAIGHRLDDAEANTARLVVRTSRLLLVYTPRDEASGRYAESIRSVAIASSVDQELWKPLVDLLAARADFDDVKKAVFQLHERMVRQIRKGSGA